MGVGSWSMRAVWPGRTRMCVMVLYMVLVGEILWEEGEV